MEYMIQNQNSFTQSIDRLEAKISQLGNIYRKEKTISHQYLTNSAISNPIDLAQDSCYFRNQDSISSQQLKLNQYQSFNKLTSFLFNEIELECECDSYPQLCDSVSILNLC